MLNIVYKTNQDDESQKLLMENEIQEELVKFEKSSLLISLVFLQVLAEISADNNDKAYLLFKAFKLFFVQQEKRNMFEKNKIIDKINYYKELCKTLVSKNPKIPNMDTINDILCARKLSAENLNRHKDLIEIVMHVNREKTNEIYLLTSEIEILTKELRYWIYDYDKVKHCKELKKIKDSIIIEILETNIETELGHKK